MLCLSRENSDSNLTESGLKGAGRIKLSDRSNVPSYLNGLNSKQLKEIQKIVEEHKEEIANVWKKHFKGGNT